MERRLTTVFVADIVGYSRLVEDDEEGTLERLRQSRVSVEASIASHHGRVFGSAGDSVLAEFSSPVDAVRCAVEIQRECSERDHGLDRTGQLVFRIGINTGDVVVDGQNLLGDGVNVAARLESLAEPGGVLISKTVFDFVSGKIDVALVSEGTRKLKNIAKPVEVYVVDINGKLDGVEKRTYLTDPGTYRSAIAVLPFDNMSADPEQEYFSDGLTEDIITALTQWRSFQVIARNSSFSFKGKNMDIRQVASELGARYILEGSVRKSGNRVRISAQLVDGTDGHQIWANKYDGDLSDIFEVQDDLVQRISALIAPELTKAELERSANRQTENLTAWDYYLRGISAVRQRTAEGNSIARDHFSRAIELQPDYSDAYSGLARSYSQDVLIGATEDRFATATKAMDSAQKAVAYDEASATAHHELSTAYQWLNRPDDALAEARISVELNPNDAYGLHALGNKSDLSGDPDGIGYMERAQKLNPADAQLPSQLSFLARAYVNQGDYSRAIDRAKQALRRNPDFAPALFILAIAYGLAGENEEASRALKKCEEASPGFIRSREHWAPYVSPDSNKLLHQGLKNASLER
ncbi:adenylate/guanylate cyclase domain-containing protein [Ruegeria arenilitoris]|uniref:adenylate/guanylate cyclase domain-containing protein n=1 Tax=Ruegeria arenilitoris TaxID=1173585 RepID=UPI0014803AE6|nr:adenylate/guanylate cyclase domain-containing protein [Ruegeria arenilitoris]